MMMSEKIESDIEAMEVLATKYALELFSACLCRVGLINATIRDIGSGDLEKNFPAQYKEAQRLYEKAVAKAFLP